MFAKIVYRDWRIVFGVVLSGLCLGLSQPLVIGMVGPEPLGGSHGFLGLLCLVGYAPIIYWLRGASVGRAFAVAFWASLIHFFITFYWLMIAMTVFGNISIVVSSAVLLAMSGILACYIGCAFAAAQFLHRRFGFAHYLIVPAAVCAVEYMRNYGFVGGFPWGNIGYAVSQVSVFLQSASLVGIYGLVFLVVMLNALLADFAFQRFNVTKIPIRKAALFLGTIVLLIGFGAYRLSYGFEMNGKVLRVALLQGNIEQGIKNKAQIYSDEILSRYQDLQNAAAAQGAQLAIWPESAHPLTIPQKISRMNSLGDSIPATVVGAVIKEDGDVFRNGALVLDSELRVVGQYYKSHLVPFGEYVPWPFRKMATRVVPHMGAFMPGNEYKPIYINLEDKTRIGLGITICYEGVFPEISRAHVANGADLLVNMTNDAWYGVSSAPYQHLHMYRVRSVETGVPFFRATNTGVSAWIDTLGFVHDPTQLYEKALVIADVPLAKRQTLYMMIGDVVAQLSLAFVLIALMLGLVGRDVFLRRRALPEWVIGGLGLALVLWSSWHFADAKAALDESALTKQTFVTAYGFLLLAGAWSGKIAGRKALIVGSGIMMLLSLLVGLAEGYEFLWVAPLSVTVAAAAYLRAKAYH